MDFLIVLRPAEIEGGWDARLQQSIKERGESNNFLVVNSLEEAKTRLQDPKTHFDQVITGSFGASMEGGWRRVQQAATPKKAGVTLITSLGIGIDTSDLPRLKEEGVGVIDKADFVPTMNNFLDQIFPIGRPKEIPR